MILGALQKTTLIDYPGKIAALVFTVGCNFNCGFCYNSGLRDKETQISEEDFFKFLDSRKGKLEAVCITGGEPTLHRDLPEFVSSIKKRGFLVKLDTQGSNPDMLKKMLEENILDYVAMDIKGPLEKYDQITKVLVNKEKILQSIKYIMNLAPDYEFRTTTVAEDLSVEDFEKIGDLINGAKRYYIQKFMSTESISDKKYLTYSAPSEETLEEMKKVMERYVSEVYVR